MMRIASFLLFLLAAAPALAGTPIPNAGDWMVVKNPSGCWVEVDSGNSNVQTKIILAMGGTPMLVAGRPDWNHNDNDTTFTLQIDDGPAEPVRGGAMGNMILVGIDQPERLERLRSARKIAWQLPWGNFHADVAGLGAALDALKECQRALGQQ